MSVLDSIKHVAAQPLGWGAQAAGATLSLGGLINNNEANRLTSVGHAITNPNVSYNGSMNPLASNFGPSGGTNWTAATPAISAGAAGGDGSSSPQNLQASDPYAAYGGTAAYNSLRSGFGTQHDQLLSSANDAIGSAHDSLLNGQGGILDFLDTIKSGQTAIDRKTIQNELAKKQGSTDVLGMVGRGLQSGGVVLANKNASNSSAGDALARAYGDIGRRSMSQVGNQFAAGQTDIANAQTDLGTQEQAGVRHINQSKNDTINTIVSDAQTKLAALDAQIASANLPDRINIEAEKNNIKTNAIGQLSELDQVLQSGMGGINPISGEDARGQAFQQAQAGVAPENAFQYDTQTPVQFQNTGPFASNLPLFTFPGAKKQTA